MKTFIPTSPAIENLEPKLAPAGTVMLSTAGGVLTITGDGGNNQLLIQDAPMDGEWDISDPGASGTIFILNGTSMGTGSFSIPAQDAIKATLGDGDDILHIRAQAGANTLILNTLSLNLGKGSDTLHLGIYNQNQHLQVLGATSIDGGDGDDMININTHSTFGGAVDIKTGTGADAVFFSSAIAEQAFLKGVKIDLGTGGNNFLATTARFDVLGGAFSLVSAGAAGVQQELAFYPAAASIQGAFSMSGGAGSSNFTLGVPTVGNLQFNSTVSITGGAGEDSMNIGNVKIAGAMTVDLKEGENHFLVGPDANATVGSLTLKAGAGEDNFNQEGGSILTLVGALSISFGAGDNRLETGIGSTLRAGSFSYTGGAGEDNLEINGAAFQILGAVLFNAGNGTNELIFSNSSSAFIGGMLTYTGGTGADTLTFEDGLQIGGLFSADLKDGANKIELLNDASLTAGGLAQKGGKDTDYLVLGNGATMLLRGGLTMNVGTGPANGFTVAGGSIVSVGSLTYTAGATGADVFSIAGDTLEVLGNMTLALGGDTNVVTVSNAVSALVLGNVNITGGAGTDVATLDAALRINGSLIVNQGGDINSFHIGGSGAEINGAFSYTGGSGTLDSVDIVSTSLRIAGALTLKMGDGTNSVTLKPTAGVIGSVAFTGGKGVDQLIFGDTSGGADELRVLGGITGTFGDGVNQAVVDDTTVQGPLTLVSASKAQGAVDAVVFTRASLIGPVKITLGANASQLTVEDSLIQGAFTADTGAGADQVKLDTNTSSSGGSDWFGKVTIATGAGVDNITIGSNPPAANASNIFYRAVVIDGGAETDVFVEGNNTKLGAFESKNI